MSRYRLRFRQPHSAGSTGGGSTETVLMRIGYTDADVPAIRLRLQTPSSAGGDRELFQGWVTNLSSVFTRAVSSNNYYSIDAGYAAMDAADLWVLNPSDTSWAASSVTFGTAIDSQAKCVQLVEDLLLKSIYHRNAVSSVTCVDLVNSGAATSTGSDGLSEPVHIWSGTPTATRTPVFYCYDKVASALPSTARTNIELAMVAWANGVVSSLATVSAPNWPGDQTVFQNHAIANAKYLGVAAAQVLIGRSLVSTSVEAGYRDAFQKCYLDRVPLEMQLYTQYGWPSPGTNEGSPAGDGYIEDNQSGIDRLALWLAPSTAWRSTAATRVTDYLTNVPYAVMQALFPGENSTAASQGWVCSIGEVGNGHVQIKNGGEWVWVAAAAMSRYGLTTAARQMRWIMDTYIPTTTINGVAVPAPEASAARKAAWSFQLIMGGTVFGNTALPITSLPTKVGPLGLIVASDIFDNPTRATYVEYAAMTKRFTSRPDQYLHQGRLVIRHRGSVVQGRMVGGDGKGPFASDVGTWFHQGVSKFGIYKLAGGAWTIAAQGYNDGYPDGRLDTAMSGAVNAADFSINGARYAHDPDHAKGAYIGYEQFWNTASRFQEEFLERKDKGLVISFGRISPNAGYAAVYRWASPVHLNFSDGSTTIPDHYLQPGTPAKGVWISSNATTFVGEDNHPTFTATHRGISQQWPATDAKWFVTALAPNSSSFHLEYRGYDATFTPAVLRNNLESQLGNSDYGRNHQSPWQGISAAHTNGVASSIVRLTDSPPAGLVSSRISEIAIDTLVGSTGFHSSNVYPGTFQSSGTFTLTSTTMNISAGAPVSYNLLDTDGLEMYYASDSNGDNVRRVAGDGTGRIIYDTSTKAEVFVIRKLGQATDSTFVKPTYTLMTETDVLGVHVLEDNLAFVVARAHPSSVADTAWDQDTDFLVPTTRATEVQVVNRRPGPYSIAGTLEASTKMRITVTAHSTGLFTASTGVGRLTFTAAGDGAGGVTISS